MAIKGIPASMTACQVVEFHKPYRIGDVPTPQSLAGHELLVKIGVASLCHTDSMVTSGVFASTLPLVASHEGAGTVVAAGSDVNDFKPGDRVLCGLTYGRCGKCAECQGPENYTQYCPNVKGACGIGRDGFFAEYAIVDGREASHLPDGVSFETAAPLACAGITVYRGVLQSELKAGEWLALVGSGGGLGHLGIQFAKAKGLRVIGIDARDEGLALSKETGADVVIDARLGKEKVVEEVEKCTGGRRAEATVNVSDHPTAAGLAAAVTRLHGRMIQIAQPPEVSIPFVELVFRDVRVSGSLCSSHGEAQEMLNLVAERGIKVHTNPFRGLEKIPELLEYAHSGKMKGKGVIVVDEAQVQ